MNIDALHALAAASLASAGAILAARPVDPQRLAAVADGLDAAYADALRLSGGSLHATVLQVLGASTRVRHFADVEAYDVATEHDLAVLRHHAGEAFYVGSRLAMLRRERSLLSRNMLTLGPDGESVISSRGRAALAGPLPARDRTTWVVTPW